MGAKAATKIIFRKEIKDSSDPAAKLAERKLNTLSYLHTLITQHHEDMLTR